VPAAVASGLESDALSGSLSLAPRPSPRRDAAPTPAAEAARYRVLRNTVVRADFPMESARLRTLKAGATIVTLEQRMLGVVSRAWPWAVSSHSDVA
jgi:hypothetical protein